MSENQSVINAESMERTSKRGGARLGAGRKPIDLDSRFLAARANLTPVHAAIVLSQIANEREIWKRLLTSDDDRIVLGAMTFLVQMRDGRPAQQINVNSISVNFSAEEIARARSVVRELITDTKLLPQAIDQSVSEHDTPSDDSEHDSPHVRPDDHSEQTEKHNAVGGQGAKKDGDGG